jgi:hypothetical protein
MKDEEALGSFVRRLLRFIFKQYKRMVNGEEVINLKYINYIMK